MDKNRPKVSLGLLVYNGEEFLSETITSLLAQTYEDFELVISDNGSTDGTRAICTDFADQDSRIRCVHHAENRGASWNFAEAFRLSQGEYFKWCTHDDPCEPDFLKTCVDMLDANPALVWCMSGIQVIDRFGRDIEDVDASCSGAAQHATPADISPDGQVALHSDYEFPYQRFRKVLLGGTACMDMLGLIRSRNLAKANLHYLYRGYEKVVMAELALQGHGVRFDTPLFKYRFHSQASIALHDIRAQQRWCDPNRNWRFTCPRLCLLRDFLRVPLRHPLSLAERARCLAAVGRYLLQLEKWGPAFRRMREGTGMDNDNRARLREIEDDNAPSQSGEDDLESASEAHPCRVPALDGPQDYTNGHHNSDHL